MGLISEVAAQAAKIGYLAVIPEQGMDRRKIETVDHVVGRANSRGAGHLSVVIDGYGEPVRIAAVGGELFNLAVFPNRRLVLLDLKLAQRRIVRWAGGIDCRRLRVAGHFASVVDRTSGCVVAPES